ncbi:peptidylprolyl isomerase [Hydrogenivirga sp.]
MYGLIQKHKRIAAIIIAVASLSFLFWMFSVSDIRQMFGLQRCVAVVGDYCITPREFMHELRRYQELLDKPELRKLIRRQVLYGLVNREVLYQKAKEVGLVASDREVADVIKSDKSFHKDGRFSIELYRETIERTGMTPEEYEVYLKKILSIRKLFSFLERGTYLSDKEIDFQIRILSARFSGRAYLFSPSSIKVSYKPSLEELKKFYSENKDRFSLPPTRRFRVWEIEDKGKAHSLYRGLKEGKIPEGGKPYTEAELPKELSSRAKSLKIEDPVTLTKVGGKYYVLFLEKFEPSRVKSFKESIKEIENLLVERRKAELVERKAREAVEALKKGRSVGGKPVRFDNSTVEEFITLFKIRGDEVLKLVFSREKVFGPYPTAGGYAVLYIDRRSFDTGKVKNLKELRESLMKAKLDSLINMFTDRLLDRSDVRINEEYLR